MISFRGVMTVIWVEGKDSEAHLFF